MNAWSRIGTGLLGLAGSLVACLMAYTLFFAGWRMSTAGKGGEPAIILPRVAVFLPDHRDWTDFQQAVLAGVPRGIFRLVQESEGALVVESSQTGRRVDFRHYGVRGVSDTQARVRTLRADDPTTIAVIGSTTTVLTVALAEPLGESGKGSPVLLVPWATTVMAQRSAVPQGDAPREPIPLMDLDPGRTFRFCPNNRRLADSVVDCLGASAPGQTPGRVYLIVDPFDPYSEDLAACFRRAIRAMKPDVEIVERADAVDLPGLARPLDPSPEPTAAQVDLADSIVTETERDPGRVIWAVLPLQDHPARRMIAALRRRSAWRSKAAHAENDDRPGPLRVVCGDAIERQAFDRLAEQGGLSIWCASTSSSRPSLHGISDDTQALAEIVSAIVWAVDQGSNPTPDADEIRVALRRIDLPGDSPYAFGRRLAFDARGERRGDPERVLSARVTASRPIEYARAIGGSWVAVVPSSSPSDPR